MQTLNFTATRYLPPYSPHVGPLDPVTCKEAALFTVYTGPLDPHEAHVVEMQRNAFLTPATAESFGPGNTQRSRASLLGIRPLDPLQDLTTLKDRVAAPPPPPPPKKKKKKKKKRYQILFHDL